ncbi:hypothetical protein H310_02736 [Aphanomyces invadans]|uniref:Uncharacterized protein n=1 Tax=Aphanomyces invadans TaxID=157072 RepID=A0A024ULL8_9STRA|nr:hypothetical protein H310_02736 [Aphanomyces invadans]ETW06493.1 hypothetical protein H310_02736 [Aphanomyces invadans]|eukprot:XP_008864568.1 hypothetical protein H310_02736 [Aphanomyces invadans]
MLGNSVTWEKVSHLSVQDEAQMQFLDAQANLADAKKSVTRNSHGIDMAADGKAIGVWRVTVLGAEDLNLDGIVDLNLTGTTTVVGTVAIAASAVEKGKLYVRAAKTDPTTVDSVTKRCFWNKGSSATVVFTGIKSKAATATFTLHHPSPVVADVFVGTCKLDVAQLLDQEPVSLWVPLAGPPGQTSSESSYGRVHVSMTFEYDAVARLERTVAKLASRREFLEAEARLFDQTAPLVQATIRHPAAFGSAAAAAGLYIPGHRFTPDVFHPAAVARTPLADGTKVVTPFGKGTVVTFRESTRMYVVLMAASPGQVKRTTTAYLREDSVSEDIEVKPRLRPGVKVSTPYGSGTVVSVRAADGVVCVQSTFGTLFMQPKDVALEGGVQVADMTNKERIDAAVAKSSEGNAAFKAEALDEAVTQYLSSLTFLKHVDQDSASHKEKAVVLQTMIRCHLNLAACKLKKEEHADAWTAASNAISILQALTENRHGKVAAWMGRLGMTEAQIFNEWPSKARFRRATALVAMENVVEARQDLMVAVKLMPKDKACRQLLDVVTKRIALEKEKEKLRWGGFLVNPPEQATSSASSTPKAKPLPPKSKAIMTTTKSIDAETKKDEAVAWYQSTTVLAAASVAVAGAAVLLIAGLSKRNK